MSITANDKRSFVALGIRDKLYGLSGEVGGPCAAPLSYWIINPQ